VKPTFRDGKMFVGGEEVKPRHYLTCYGSNGVTIYTAILWADGTTSCNCPAWRFEKKGVRKCKHSERAGALTADVDETDTRPTHPTPAAAGESPQGTNPFRRRTRSVDT
jgi:hypothetical protein